MIVRELIEKLKKVNQEKEVVLINGGESPFGNGTIIERVFEISGTDNDDYVFLESE